MPSSVSPSSEFSRMMGEISTNIQTFSFNTQKVNSFSAKIGTILDSDFVRTELSRLTDSTRELAKQIGEQFKIISNIVAALPKAEQRERRIQSNRLRDQFMATLSQFQQQQREIMEREKNSILRARMSRTGGSGGSETTSFTSSKRQQQQDVDETASENDPFLLPRNSFNKRNSMVPTASPRDYYDDPYTAPRSSVKRMSLAPPVLPPPPPYSGKRASIAPSPESSSGDPYAKRASVSPLKAQQQAQLTTQYELAIDYAALVDRERELRRLENDIVNANQIFKDMAQLVYEQNITIEKVEDQVGLAAGHVDQGNQVLVKAVELKRKSRKKKIICCLILLSVLGLFGLIIGLYFGLKNKV